MKLLMQCKHLQSYVIKALVKKLPLYAENESVQVDPCFGISDTAGADIINMPRLILNQLRWLDVVVDSTEIATELLEMASIMQSEVLVSALTANILTNFVLVLQQKIFDCN